MDRVKLLVSVLFPSVSARVECCVSPYLPRGSLACFWAHDFVHAAAVYSTDGGYGGDTDVGIVGLKYRGDLRINCICIICRRAASQVHGAIACWYLLVLYAPVKAIMEPPWQQPCPLKSLGLQPVSVLVHVLRASEIEPHLFDAWLPSLSRFSLCQIHKNLPLSSIDSSQPRSTKHRAQVELSTTHVEASCSSRRKIHCV